MQTAQNKENVLTLIKGRMARLEPRLPDDFQVSSYVVEPALPLGLQFIIDGNQCKLTGAPSVVTARNQYQLTLIDDNKNTQTQYFSIAVVEAPVGEQRSEIIKVNNVRRDLSTPRSQLPDAVSDAQLGSSIKPHEKFLKQPMGDDSHLTAQAANNPDAEMRAQASPELTPSPSAQLQNQAVMAAKMNITPTPSR